MLKESEIEQSVTREHAVRDNVQHFNLLFPFAFQTPKTRLDVSLGFSNCLFQKRLSRTLGSSHFHANVSIPLRRYQAFKLSFSHIVTVAPSLDSWTGIVVTRKAQSKIGKIKGKERAKG